MVAYGENSREANAVEIALGMNDDQNIFDVIDEMDESDEVHSLKQEIKKLKTQIENCQSEQEIWSADNVILTKKMFKDEIRKYLKSEYDKMKRLMQLLEIQ